MEQDDPLVRTILRQTDRLIGGPARLLLAVSGGADSVALCRAIAAGREPRGWDARVIHVHHGLRAAADEDERFVMSLAGSLELPFLAKRVDVPAARRRAESVETAARRCRYAAFARLAETSGAAFVLTGHTADDQAETVLHRVIRGSGLAGLGGIPERRRLAGATPPCTVVRPLLTVRRKEILALLDRLGQSFRCDESNADPRHTRSRLRQQTIPELTAAYNPRLSEALIRLGRIARAAQGVVDERLTQLRAECVRVDEPGRIAVDPRSFLAKRGPSGRFELAELVRSLWVEQGWPARDLGAAALDRLIDLLEHPAGRISLPAGVAGEWNGDLLVLSRTGMKTRSPVPERKDEQEVPQDQWPLPLPGRIRLPGGLSVSAEPLARADLPCPLRGPRRARVELLDRDCLTPPCHVRFRRAGDRFTPLGMSSPQKLKDFLNAARVPLSERAAIPLVCDVEGIIWVAGIRIAARVAVGPETERLVRFSLELGNGPP